MLGAHVVAGGVKFSVWATKANEVVLVLRSNGLVSRFSMERDDAAVFAVFVESANAGDTYAFEVDGSGPFPDPRSRFQPDGVHGFSEIVDPGAFAWSDSTWTGLGAEGLIIYELHVGTMTFAGTFRSLMDELPELANLGINAIEIMPVAECPGRWNWGYDGVELYAPSHNYGRPDDLRALVDASHAVGIGVILDVVYNHLGPEGNYLGVYSDFYTSKIHTNSWGAGLNWDGEGSEFVRAFAIDSATQWISEYHFDGLRLDATHALVDDSPVHLVRELTAIAREAAGDRSIYVVAEDERREMTRVRSSDRGGDGLDAVWADDFHHEMRVSLMNSNENYYSAYSGTAKEIATAINNGFGDEGFERGTPPDTSDPGSAFVFCIQNHDQVGNRPFGDRLHHEANLERYKVASALLLFVPETPLLFMGQEFAASTPFLFFTDHPEDLGKLVTEGRRREFAGFRLFEDEALRETIPDPQAESTFHASKLNGGERVANAEIYELYRELIAMRKADPVLNSSDRSETNAKWLTAEIVAVHRWRKGNHRLLIANFGNAAVIDLAKFPDVGWVERFSTGESGLIEDQGVSVPARTALVLGGG